MTGGKHELSVSWGNPGEIGHCSCGGQWIGPTYEAVEDEWRRHYYSLTGTVLRACGSQENRWRP